MPARWTPNVTVAAIIEQDGRFLLVEEDTPEGPRLNNPAGHLEPGESPAAGCAREALEETAHPFTPTALLGVYLSRFTRAGSGEDVTWMRLAFTGVVGEAIAGRRLDEGIRRVLWMDVEAVRASRAQHRSPLVLRCVEDHLAGHRWPLDLVYCHPSLWAPEARS